MSLPASSAPAEERAPRPAGRLPEGVLRAGDVVVMAMASSGPTQSIAVTLAALLATVGYATFLPARSAPATRRRGTPPSCSAC